MKRYKILLAVFMICSLFFQLLPSNSVFAQNEAPEYDYLIKFKNEEAKTLGKEKIERNGGKVKKEFKHLKNVQAVTLTQQLLTEFKNNPSVEAIEPDFSVKALGENVPWGIQRVGAEKAHSDGIVGDGVKIAVFDTGISSHPDLSITGGVSFVPGEESYSDQNGHGTHVAGTISAIMNDQGLRGVAPSANLYAVKVLAANGSGYYSSIIQGIEWAIDNNINIINMSFGGTQNSEILANAIDLAYQNNIFMVAAAGNAGKGSDTLLYPAKYSQVIAVGAIDQNNERATFSSVGPELELVAPGVDINSSLNDGSYGSKSGTSMASPHVAGVAALLWSQNLSVSNTTIRGLLDNSAIGLGDKALYGNGMVNAYLALDMYNDYIYGEKVKSKEKKAKTKLEKNKKELIEKPIAKITGIVESYNVESPHPYSNNYSNTWRISKSGASSIRVHFAYIDTESGYDYVRTSAGDSWDGYYSGVWSSWYSGSYIDVTLTTDGSVTANGFIIDQIEYVASSAGSGTVEAYYLDSPHPYSNNYSNTWTISKAGASNIRVYFEYIDTESGYDYVTTSAGNSWDGYYSGVWSNWSGSSSINVSLTTDGSVTRNGFRITQIEYVGGGSTDDHGNSMGSATYISVGSSVSGNIDYAGDEDFFRFTPTVSGTHIIGTSGSTDTYGYLYNSSGSQLASNDDSNGTLNFAISYNLTANQTYYVKVRHYSSSGTGAYSLTVSAPAPTDDHGNSMSSATAISVNTNVSGNIDYAGDEDYFRFVPTVSGSFIIGTSSSIDTYGYLYDSSGNQLAYNDDSNGTLDFSITHTLTANQTYYIKVRHYSSSGTGAYTLRVSALPDLIVTDVSWSPTNPVAGNPVTLSAIIKNQGTTATASGTTQRIGFSVNGTLVSSVNYSSSIAPGVSISVTGSSTWVSTVGTHTITAVVDDLNSISESNEANNSLSESVVVAEGDIHGNSIGSASTIAVGTTVNAAIDYAGDVDFFKVTPTTSGAYVFESTGTTDTFGELYDSNGILIQYNDDYNETNLCINQALVANATYYLKVRHYNPTGTGSYNVMVTLNSDDHSNLRSSATSLQVGNSVNGNLEYDEDEDFFAVTPTSSGIYKIFTTGVTDTYGEIYDSTGDIVWFGDDNEVDLTDLNFLMFYRFTAGQTYYIKVAKAESSDVGSYTLSVVSTGDDHSNTIGTATSLVLDQEVAGNIEVFEDIDFFAFTPSTTASYSIFTTGNTDTYGELLDSSGNLIAYNDDSIGLNFQIIRTLTAGQTYYIKVRHYDLTDGTGVYGIKVLAQ